MQREIAPPPAHNECAGSPVCALYVSVVRQALRNLIRDLLLLEPILLAIVQGQRSGSNEVVPCSLVNALGSHTVAAAHARPTTVLVAPMSQKSIGFFSMADGGQPKFRSRWVGAVLFEFVARSYDMLLDGWELHPCGDAANSDQFLAALEAIDTVERGGRPVDMKYIRSIIEATFGEDETGSSSDEGD